MRTAGEVLLAFVALYPVCTAALWMAGGMLFRRLEEPTSVEEPQGGWPGVSVLIPAYNEENVIATCARAALAVDYPNLEVLVLDDGSTDGTEAAAEQAADGDRRFRLLRDPVNRGKADRLNFGLREARHELVAVIDADTHLDPYALKLVVTRMHSSPMVAAVAGAPHVTNRGRFLLAMQVLEAAATIGLIRRTQSLTGRVGVVAGVLGLFRRDRVLAVGGYDPRMATEDIDLTWRLLLAGWETVYEPHAFIGMQVPSTLRALWAQRTRWARGQGEVLHVHLRDVSRWRNHRMWLLAFESLVSLALDPRPRRFADHHRAGQRARRRGPIRIRIRMGDRDRRDRDTPADRGAHARARLRPDQFASIRDRGPVTRLPTGSSPVRHPCARRRSRSFAVRADSASSGTSHANGSKPRRTPRRVRHQRIADDIRARPTVPRSRGRITLKPPMRASAAVLAALICGSCLGLAACGGSTDRPGSDGATAARTPLPAPDVTLTSDEKQVWAKLPPDRSAIPVLLYHGIGPESDFSNAADASYGVGTEDFAKQMTLIQHAGYQTIDLQTFIDFVQNKPVDLPPRPLLLTFDDARADSWTGADGILRKLHFNAVMFVDVGRVDGGDPEYLTWQELATVQDSGRWQLQLHSGRGPHADPVRPGTRRLRAVLRLREAGRGLRRLARAGALRHRLGPDDARRSHLRPTSRSPSLRRSAATARTAPTTRGSPTTSSAGSRNATTPSSPRT